MAEWLTTEAGRRIAYHRTDGRTPAVVFCGGFRSDMTGTKALHLEAWAQSTGALQLAFPRYHPSWAWWLTRVPGVREFAVSNLTLVLQK